MHEMAIAMEIKDIVLEKLKEHRKSRVLAVGLIFGELTSVVPEALKTAFTAVSEGTPMQGAKIRCTVKKIKAKCRMCGKVFRVKDFIYSCPSCKAPQAEMVQGREMIVKSVTME